MPLIFVAVDTAVRFIWVFTGNTAAADGTCRGDVSFRSCSSSIIISINVTAATAARHNVRRFRSNEKLLSAHNEVAGRGKVERPLQE